MVDTDVTRQFIDALAALERDRNAERITALFGPESEIGNIVSPRQFSGVEGSTHVLGGIPRHLRRGGLDLPQRHRR